MWIDIQKTSRSADIIFAEYNDVADTKAYFETLKQLQDALMSKNAVQRCMLPHAYRSVYKERFTLCRVRTTAYGDEENETFLKQILYRPESRLLYGLLHHYTQKIESYKKDKTLKKSAMLMMEEAQSHFLFWSFNKPWGIHNMELRQSLYQAFAAMENTIKGTQSKTSMQILHTDVNLDGHKEFMVFSPSLNAIIETKYGSLCTLQRRVRRRSWNYCAPYSQWSEALPPSWSFVETVIPKTTDIKRLHVDMLPNTYKYSPVVFDQVASSNKKQTSIIFSQSQGRRQCANVISSSEMIQASYNVTEPDFDVVGVSVEKQYTFKTNAIHVDYRFTNDSETERDIYIAVQINITFANGDPKSLFAYIPSKKDDENSMQLQTNAIQKTTTDTISFTHASHGEGMRFDFSPGSQVCIAPVYCGAFESEQVYQYTAMLVFLPVMLLPNNYEQLFVNVSFITTKP